uniref:Uncharacterized protein n=1 Tax=Timema monikensis TaxID=170555 RepID=A0A7R9HIJ9_9NEOP|nr:unnamed protein product [Timema monikensis]
MTGLQEYGLYVQTIKELQQYDLFVQTITELQELQDDSQGRKWKISVWRTYSNHGALRSWQEYPHEHPGWIQVSLLILCSCQTIPPGWLQVSLLVLCSC